MWEIGTDIDLQYGGGGACAINFPLWLDEVLGENSDLEPGHKSEITLWIKNAAGGIVHLPAKMLNALLEATGEMSKFKKHFAGDFDPVGERFINALRLKFPGKKIKLGHSLDDEGKIKFRRIKDLNIPEKKVKEPTMVAKAAMLIGMLHSRDDRDIGFTRKDVTRHNRSLPKSERLFDVDNHPRLSKAFHNLLKSYGWAFNPVSTKMGDKGVYRWLSKTNLNSFLSVTNKRPYVYKKKKPSKTTKTITLPQSPEVKSEVDTPDTPDAPDALVDKFFEKYAGLVLKNKALKNENKSLLDENKVLLDDRDYKQKELYECTERVSALQEQVAELKQAPPVDDFKNELIKRLKKIDEDEWVADEGIKNATDEWED